MDKRKVRTMYSISKALLEMMAENELDQISITDLVSKANVSRTAFYRYYTSKEDVIKVLSKNLSENQMKECPGELYLKDKYAYFNLLFAFFRKNKELFLAIKNAYSLNNYIISDLKLFDFKGMTKLSYSEAAAYGEMIMIILKWLSSGMEESDDEMAQICVSNVGQLKKIEM